MLWSEEKLVNNAVFMNVEKVIIFVYSLDYINVRKAVPASCRHPVSGMRSHDRIILTDPL